MRRIWPIVILVALAAGTIGVFATQAGGAAPVTNVYTAKFACGEFGKTLPASAASTPEGPAVPGFYQTAINVHDPNRTVIQFQKKAVLVFAGRTPVKATAFEVVHQPGQLIPKQLPPDGAMLIDCQDIRAVLLPGAPAAPVFIEGVVVILVPGPTAGGPPPPLDVQALYTSHGYNCSAGAPCTREGFSEQFQVIQPTQAA